MLKKIEKYASEIESELLEIRRHLHMYPELSGAEFLTSNYILGSLTSSGLSIRENVGKTGFIAELEGTGKDERTLAIRTDFDALPINENTKLEFSSKNPGVMHACGHDVHSTVGIGTAMVLAKLQDELPGKVRFLFQPAEEIAAGANWMIEDGALENVSAILGLHVLPSINAGHIGVRHGCFTASIDSIEITIFGESSNAESSYQATDAIWIASQIIIDLQQSISKTMDPRKPVVLTIGQIEGGTFPNTVADEVQLRGTVRTLHNDVRHGLSDWLENILSGICNTYGAKYKFDFQPKVPPIVNDSHISRLIEESAREILGSENIQLLEDPSMGSEDFANYLDYCPGSMFRLGVGFKDVSNYPLHHPKFNIDESSIKTGVLVMSYSAYNFFK